MKILFVSAYDSMNYTLAECAAKAKMRGHKVYVIVKGKHDVSSNKMYENKGLVVIDINEWSNSRLDEIDLAVTAPMKLRGFGKLFSEIRKRDIFVISFASLFSSILMREYPDIALCIGESKFKEFKDNALSYNCIAIGNPQYDPLIKDRKGEAAESEIRRVLIIDQGGYPYGAKGKRQLAKTLKSLALSQPGREFAIKPRYAGKGLGKRVHAVSENLTDFLEDRPDNLKILDADVILEDILHEYDAMITTWSTAYADAVMMGLPLVLISGLDSIDVFDVRKKRIEQAYERLEETGCVYDFRDIASGNFTYARVSPKYESEEIYSAGRECTGDVLDLFEFIYENLIKKNKRIEDHIECGLQEFYQGFKEYKLADVSDGEYKKRHAFAIKFNKKMQEWVYLNRCMGSVLDLSPLREFYDNASGRKYEEALEEAGKIYAAVKERYFTSSEGMKRVNEDRVLQDFYFDWLFETKRFDELAQPKTDVLAPESRVYNLALMELSKNNQKRAYAYLTEFLRFYFEKENPVVDLLKEKRLAKAMIRFCKADKIIPFGLFLLRDHHMRILLHFGDDLVTDYGITTAFAMREAYRAGSFDKCEKLFSIYDCKRKSKKRVGLKDKLLKSTDVLCGLPIKRINRKCKRAMRAKEQNKDDTTNSTPRSYDINGGTAGSVSHMSKEYGGHEGICEKIATI